MQLLHSDQLWAGRVRKYLVLVFPRLSFGLNALGKLELQTWRMPWQTLFNATINTAGEIYATEAIAKLSLDSVSSLEFALNKL